LIIIINKLFDYINQILIKIISQSIVTIILITQVHKKNFLSSNFNQSNLIKIVVSYKFSVTKNNVVS